MTFTKVMTGKDLTRRGVLDTFDATPSLATDGLTPTVDFTKGTGVKGFVRLFNPTVVNHEIKDGKLVDIAPHDVPQRPHREGCRRLAG